ncbi:MAG: hypothetical protein Q8Q62_05950 [Mesorhizobium sp.]|nr:hypothetical protein [Mesorhizobium sp.]
MRQIRVIAAALFAAATFVTGPAAAQPTAPVSADGLVLKVSGCHRDVQRHYVPEFDRRAWHYHAGSRCRPIEVDRPGFVPEEPVYRDCHRDVQRHFLREYGRSVVHRHVGPDCRVRELRQSTSPRPGFCVQVGPLTFCD